MVDTSAVEVSVVVPVKDDDDGLAFTLSAVNAAAAFGKGRAVEVVVVDASVGGSQALRDSSAKWPNIVVRQMPDPGLGPYAAVDIGLRQSVGAFQTWLNAGDYLFPQAIDLVATVFGRFQDIEWVCGYSCLMTERGYISRVDAKPVHYPRRLIQAGLYRKSGLGYLQQEGMFWRKDLYERSGGLDLSLRLAADFDLWQRFSRQAQLISIASTIAAFEVAPQTQRSRRYEGQYVAEVESRTSPSFLAAVFRGAASIHYGLVVLLRMLFFSTGKVIAIDVENGDLRRCSGVWPSARVSVWSLLLVLRARQDA